MTKSFTSIVAALTIALVAGSTFAPTTASAKDGRNARIAIGALAGLGGALLGATIANGQPRHAEGRYDQRPVRFIEEAEEEEECFEKPIKRFDRYSGETIVVGYKTVCR